MGGKATTQNSALHNAFREKEEGTKERKARRRKDCKEWKGKRVRKRKTERMTQEVEDFIFKCPFTATLAGPTSCKDYIYIVIMITYIIITFRRKNFIHKKFNPKLL